MIWHIFHLLWVKAKWSTTQDVFYGLRSVDLLIKFSCLAYYTSRSKGNHCSYCIWAMSMWHTWVRYGSGVSFLTRQEQPIFSQLKVKKGKSSGKRPGRVSHSISPHPGQNVGALLPNCEQTPDAYCASPTSRLLKPVCQWNSLWVQDWHARARSLQSQTPTGSVDLLLPCITLNHHTHRLSDRAEDLNNSHSLCFYLN